MRECSEVSWQDSIFAWSDLAIVVNWWRHGEVPDTKLLKNGSIKEFKDESPSAENDEN